MIMTLKVWFPVWTITTSGDALFANLRGSTSLITVYSTGNWVGGPGNAATCDVLDTVAFPDMDRYI